jgi:LmbE family N-acetylglucosaminyl deacetylase
MAIQPIPLTFQNLSCRSIFLQPHPDDICFSLAGFASRQVNGLLVTVCSVTSWVHPEAVPARPSPEAVTELRKTEDQNFAVASGLSLHVLALPEAPLMDWKPFDASRTMENRRRLEGPILAELNQIAETEKAGDRPWLFCPVGIGGHIDHLAVRHTIVSHRADLSRRFRIAFYEDLHYASRFQVRMAGLARFFVKTRGMKLKRWVFPLDQASIKAKLGLIGQYKSQMAKPPADLGDYSPATWSRTKPHEAIWTAEEPPEGFRPVLQSELVECLARLRAKLKSKTRT